MENSLDALRDVHLPDAISWWPLAYGYWVLLVVLLAGVVLWFRRYRRYAVRRVAQRELGRIVSQHQRQQNAHDLARQINVLLRRAVLSLQPRHEVASLTGDKWIAQLQSCSGDAEFSFSETVATLLTHGVYQAKIDVDTDALLREATAWVRSIPPRPSA